MNFTLYGLVAERKKIGDGGIFITDYLGAVGKMRTVMACAYGRKCLRIFQVL
jgi:hypothetical protein